MNQSDFVHVPGYSLTVAKQQGFNGFNWRQTHYELNKSGLYMPSASIFTSHLLNVIKAREKDKPLYDGNGNEIIKEEVGELYRILTSNCCIWLSNSFKKNKTKPGNLLMKSGYRVIGDKLISERTEPLEQCIMEDNVFVNFEFNTQGLPVKKSAKQKYAQGKNLCFYKPRYNIVAFFNSDSDRAILFCDRHSGDFSGSSLGVLACAEGAQKTSEHTIDSLIGKGTDVGDGLVVLRKEDLNDEQYSLITRKSVHK